jgi:hypothetical protein
MPHLKIYEYSGPKVRVFLSIKDFFAELAVAGIYIGLQAGKSVQFGKMFLMLRI